MDILAPIPLDWLRVLDYYLTTPRCTKRAAYESVYGKSKSAPQSASAVFSDPRTVAEIARRQEPLRAKSALKAEEILEHLHSVVTADVRDLTEVRRCACRFCYGIDFKYQRRPSEYDAALTSYRASPDGRKDPLGMGFDTLGGVGYTAKRPPHPSCPECDGEGLMLTFAKDMRNLTKAQAELIVGIKETESGFEIKTRDKTKVIQLAMQSLGMLREDKGEGDDKIPPAAKITWAVEDADKDPTHER